MRVLVLHKDVDMGMWFSDFEGRVVAETDTQYKVKKTFRLAKWIPKKGPYSQCQLISKKED